MAELRWNLGSTTQVFKRLLGGAALLLLVGACSGGSPEDLSAPAEQFFSEIARGDVESAYWRTSRAFREVESQTRLVDYLGSYQLDQFERGEWQDATFDGDTAKLEGVATVAGGTQVPVTLQFVREEDAWKLQRIDAIAPGPGQQAGGERDLPEDDAILQVAVQEMERFSAGLNQRNLGEFHENLARVWRTQTSPKELAELFAQLFEYDKDIESAIKTPARLIDRPRFNENGFLEVGLAFEQRSPRVSATHKYMYESGAWKLVGFSVNVR